MPWYYAETELRQVARPPGRPGHGLPGPERPVDPDYGVGEGGEPGQGLPGWPERPGHPIRPTLPPRDEWPEIPEDIWDKLPIKPSPEHPMVPVPDEPGAGQLPEFPPGVIWPPPRPDLPDLSGKSLVLVRVYVSRHVNYLAWQVVDHAAAKAAFQARVDEIKGRLPAGGVGGRPPQRPGPGD
jgi:hypothetical protein